MGREDNDVVKLCRRVKKLLGIDLGVEPVFPPGEYAGAYLIYTPHALSYYKGGGFEDERLLCVKDLRPWMLDDLRRVIIARAFTKETR